MQAVIAASLHGCLSSILGAMRLGEVLAIIHDPNCALLALTSLHFFERSSYGGSVLDGRCRIFTTCIGADCS
jgi:hypothetical protein